MEVDSGTLYCRTLPAPNVGHLTSLAASISEGFASLWTTDSPVAGNGTGSPGRTQRPVQAQSEMKNNPAERFDKATCFCPHVAADSDTDHGGNAQVVYPLPGV